MTVQLPDDEVTMVVPPADAALVATLPAPPEWTTTPFGPVVVPLTWPLPAVIEVDRPPAEAERPFFDETTVQLRFGPEPLPVTTVRSCRPSC